MLFKNLKEQKFGKLKAVSYKKKKDNRGYWICECDCGNVCESYPYLLLNGEKTNCGCSDGLVGLKFNKLLVIKRIPNSGRCLYLCLCDCGNEKITTARRLQTNKIDCGCGIKNRIIVAGINRRKPNAEALKNGLIHAYKGNAKRRGINFTLTKKDCIILFESNCYYCGVEPTSVYKRKKAYGCYKYNGIDRIDNSKGYEIKNVVSCCSTCNYAKSDMSVSKFLTWINNVYTYNKLTSQ